MPAAKVENTALTRDALNTIREFDKAILAHLTWLRHLHHSLVCATPYDPDNLLDDAHHHCTFGSWFYSEGMDKYRSDPQFENIRVVHKAMHQAAKSMLTQQEGAHRVRLEEYDRFMDLVVRFKQDIRSFQYHLISQVCTVDHLTGAWNRHAMSMKLGEEHERTQRSGQPCALCMMDLDYFKRINDGYGHKVGDEVLQAVTSLVNGELRRNDSLCRFGGEEFLILLPNTNLEAAGHLLNRIREKLEAATLALPSGHNLCITASFGVACLVRDEPPEDVLEQADHALLAAKAQGRNRVLLWDVGMQG